MTLRAPAPREVPEEQRARATMQLRYEDVTQDGRLVLSSLSTALGECVWRSLLAESAASNALRNQGIVPILTRLVLEGGDRPISIATPLSLEGRYELAHAVDASGAVTKIFVNMWAEASAPRGRTYGPPPDGAGQPVVVGRVYAEHVMTRLFAPPEQRKVVSLSIPDQEPVPKTRVAWAPARATMTLPNDATPLEAEATDAASISFGLVHTDSNQHVNSLVYPRLFEDAALARLASLGKSTMVAARYVEAAYRKPSFAGERVRIVMQTFELDGVIGAIGAFVEQSATTVEGARAYVRMTFDGR